MMSCGKVNIETRRRGTAGLSLRMVGMWGRDLEFWVGTSTPGLLFLFFASVLSFVPCVSLIGLKLVCV